MNFFFCCFGEKTVEKKKFDFFFCRSHLHHRSFGKKTVEKKKLNFFSAVHTCTIVVFGKTVEKIFYFFLLFLGKTMRFFFLPFTPAPSYYVVAN